MKRIHIFIATVALVAGVALSGPSSVFAQYYYNLPASVAPAQYGSYNSYSTNSNNGPITNSVYYHGKCTNITSGLYKGLLDTTTGGQVSALQSFLISENDLAIVASTGYFGALTYQALVKFQYDHGLPVNGTADLTTRTSIQSISCGNYGYNNNLNNGNYNNNYNNGYNNNYYGTPVISSLSATSGAIGSSVTIFGSGFDYSNNTVNFNGTKIGGISSYNGSSLIFTVPQVYNQNNYNYNTYNYGNTSNMAGTYSVSVTTSRGTSNSLSFMVTSGNTNCYNNNYIYGSYNNGYNNCYNNSISVSNVSGPGTISVGSQGIWSVSLYNPNSSYVSVSARWGDENTNAYGYASQQSNQSSYVQGQQMVTFNHTYQTSGYYTIVFTATDNTGANTSVSTTVNVSGGTVYNSGQPYLSSISPNSGRVGTQTVLYGSGFTPTGNVIHFGSGGSSNVYASNSGNTLYYTIPSSVGPCDIVTPSGQFCATYQQQVTTGTYPVYVSNSQGQTSTLYFTVTY